MSTDRPLRVLLSPSAYYPHVGGIEELTCRLALELQTLGHEVLLVTNRWPGGTVGSETLDGVRVRRLPLALPELTAGGLARFGLVAPASAARLLALVRAFRPHVVHLVGAGPNATYFAALAPLVRTPLVLGVQGEFGADAHHGFEVSRSLRWALGRLLREAAAVAACSSFVLDELAGSFELGAPAVVIPNGVTPAEFALPRPEANGLGRYLFAAGRLVDQKGLDVLLRAYASARPALDGRRLVIAGDGPLRAELEGLSEELGLNGSVSFLGSVGRARLASLMRGADAFAFPSRHEAFGIALLEAMAAGTPAVAAASGGIPELAGGGQALLVAPEDAGGLADALVRIVRDEPLRQRLVVAGRAQAEELSWSRLTQRYLALYRQVSSS